MSVSVGFFVPAAPRGARTANLVKLTIIHFKTTLYAQGDLKRLPIVICL